jgi:hypothetical protein
MKYHNRKEKELWYENKLPKRHHPGIILDDRIPIEIGPKGNPHAHLRSVRHILHGSVCP